MKFSVLLVFVVLYLPTASAQRHDYLWLFGYNTNPSAPDKSGNAVDFNTEPPSTYKQEKEMNMGMTMASICDSTGNLLAYTNGAWIANHAHEMMENGDSLNPGQITWNNYSSGLGVAQSHVILPMPGHPGKYYLFHERIDYHDVLILAVNPCYYSVIDMAQNNGLGRVEEKNTVIVNDTTKTFGTMTAVKHANGRDWWVVFPEKAKNVFYRFLFSPNGVEDLAVQGLSPVFPSLGSNGFTSFSPDGSRLARYEVQHGLYLYDFDRCTGLLGDYPLFVPTPGTDLGGGVSFSPNGRFVYMASSTYLLRFDTWGPVVATSLDTVAVYDGYASPLPTTFFSAQLGPDGRIYVNTTNGTDVLHYIDYPNKEGDGCRVVQHGLQLAARNWFTSPHYPNYRLGPVDGSPCDTLGLDNRPLAGFRHEADTVNALLVGFTDNSFYEPTAWHWDFGDGTASAEVDPVHAFPAPGTYTVCLTVGNQYDSDMLCKEVTVGTTGVAEGAGRGEGATLTPNPASGEAAAWLPPQVPRAALGLYAATGQQVRSQALSAGQNVVPLHGLPPGLYFYLVRDGGRVLGSGKLMVE
jgi:hypothetical protein